MFENYYMYMYYRFKSESLKGNIIMAIAPCLRQPKKVYICVDFFVVVFVFL